MRLYAVLIFAAVLIAFCDGFLFLSLKQTSFSSEITATAVDRIKARFVQEHAPVWVLDLGQLYPASAGLTLLDPATALPQTVRYPFPEMKALYDYAKDCKGKPPESAFPELRKAWAWHRFHCGAQDELSPDFFDSPPFMHPSGASYAWLHAVEIGGDDAPYELARLHWRELRKIAKTRRLRPPFPYIAALDSFGAQAMIEGAELVVADEFIFLRQARGGVGPGPARYLIYSRVEWDGFLRPRALTAVADHGEQSCPLRDGATCWKYSTGQIEYLVKQSPAILFLGLSLLVGVVGILLVRKIGEEKNDRERRRFALQTLTHELRTPLAGVTLAVEALRPSFDSLGEDAQVAFLRLCDGVQRLGRVVEVSKQYLTSRSGREFITLEPKDLPSINALVEFTLEPYRDRVTLSPLEPDRAVRCDSYWLSICLKNLVENALNHGQPPVRVAVRVRGDSLCLDVSDEGRGRALDLDQVTEAFVKDARSGGLGLGLSIVKNIVREMNGTLELTNDPTTFTIKLKL